MQPTDPATAAHPVLWTMPLIHRIIRTQFDELPGLIAAGGADTRRRAAIASHLDFAINGLTAHHTTEDEHIWPVLIERAALHTDLIERMEAQHEGIHVALGAVAAARSRWTAAPAQATGDALSAAVRDAAVIIAAHLDEEERDIVPLIAKYVTVAEWDDFGKAAFAKFTPSQRFLAMGQMLEVATPAEATAMLGDLPLPVRVIWNLVGKRKYRRYIDEVRRR